MANRKNKNALALVFILLTVFVVVTVFSALSVAEHDCTGEGCTVCILSSGTKRIFSLTVTDIAVISELVCLALVLYPAVKSDSLVSNKIKLNN